MLPLQKIILGTIGGTTQAETAEKVPFAFVLCVFVGASIYGAPGYAHNPRFPNHKDTMISSGYGNRNGFGYFPASLRVAGSEGAINGRPYKTKIRGNPV